MDSCPLLPFPSLPQLSLQGWLCHSFTFHFACLVSSLPSCAFLAIPNLSFTALHTWSSALPVCWYFKCLPGIPGSDWALESQKSSKTSVWPFPTEPSEFLPGITTSSKSSCTTNPDSSKEPFRIQAMPNKTRARMDHPHPPHPMVFISTWCTRSVPGKLPTILAQLPGCMLRHREFCVKLAIN